MALLPDEVTYQLTLPLTRRRRKSALAPQPPLARITRLVALAIRLGSAIERHKIDCNQLARSGHVSRSRLTQILNLLNLAPDIQERLLFLPVGEKGRDRISEKKIRHLAAEYDWERQRSAFERLLAR